MANGNQQDDAIGRRFSLLRKRLGQQQTARAQEESQALKRQFSRIGGLGSGAFIKQSQIAAQKRASDLAAQREGLDVAEQGARQQQEEIAKQRAFQTAEREAGQTFAAEQAGLGRRFAASQAELGREFARGERLAGQEFASLEADKQRGFSRSLFDIQQTFREKQFQAGLEQFQKQFDQTVLEQNRRFELDELATLFNKEMAQKAFDKKTLTERLLAGTGIDIGLGAGERFTGGIAGGAESFGSSLGL